jgi:DNA-binding SARP family transcriptional activator
MGETRPAFEQLTRAHTAFQALGDTIGAARLLIEIGMARRRLGQLDEAEAAYIQALELWESTHNLLWQANTLNNLGVLQHDQGNYLAAVHSLERAVECARLAGYPRMKAFALAGLGDLYRDLAAYNESTEAYRQAAAQADRVGEQYLIFYLDLARGVLARRQKQFMSAGEYFVSAAARVGQGLSYVEQAACDLELATLALVQNQPQRVCEILADAAGQFATQSARMENARRQLLLMLATAMLDDLSAASFHRQKYMETWDSSEFWPPLVALACELRPWLEQFHHQVELEPLAGHLLRQVNALEQRLPVLRRQLRPQAGVVPLGPAQIVINAFGRSEVRYNHRPVTHSDWRSLAARDLFFFLLEHPQGLTKEQIGLVFWPDASPDVLQQRFRNLIYRLRHAVGSDAVVLGSDETYRFNTNLDYEYDVETFERELTLAKQAGASEVRLQHLLLAVRQVQGPYLPDSGAEWALVARQRLQRLVLDALIDAANLGLELNRPEQALQLCQQALNMDPGTEEIHRLAMRCYAAEGDRVGLVRQYKTCIQILQEEYAVDPSPQTSRLFEDLRR